MEKVVQKLSSFAEAKAADDAYYASLSQQQRMDILLELVGAWKRACPIHRIEPVCRITTLSGELIREVDLRESGHGRIG